ncbi:MAG: 16S rRNA (cytidine(1402)-2'-O)-methyltransferase, partial [Chlorobi bacterium]|nr:16S rRNA (cytidine(1402)-2'-O)-methyltransferase [Chlorobiota bacterium]
MSGKLYLVPTPIGNLRDMTFRAVDILNAVDLILAEDTRTSSVLLRHYGIEKPVKAFHKFNEHKMLEKVMNDLSAGMQIAYITDAGMPGISDPGFLLVREAVERNIPVEVLPGASAFVTALAGSGLPSERFVFEGFLPVKKGRQTRLQKLAGEERTMVF